MESREFLPALLAVLQARAVDTDRLRRGLHTAALEEQQDYGADPVQSWWGGVLDEGAWLGEGAKMTEGSGWPTFLSLSAAYDACVKALRDAGFRVRTVRDYGKTTFPPGYVGFVAQKA